MTFSLLSKLFRCCYCGLDGILTRVDATFQSAVQSRCCDMISADKHAFRKLLPSEEVRSATAEHVRRSRAKQLARLCVLNVVDRFEFPVVQNGRSMVREPGGKLCTNCLVEIGFPILVVLDRVLENGGTAETVS